MLRSIRFIFYLLAFCSFFRMLSAAGSVFGHFITADGARLMDGDQEYRFISWNIPNLNFVEDEMVFTSEHEYALPTSYEIRDALESVRQLGGLVARTYTVPVRSENDAPGTPKYVPAPGVFDEHAFATMDTMLAVANELGIRLIVPLLNEWQWMGGRPQYAAFRGKSEDEFYTDSLLIEDYKKTIHYVLTRRNSVTGIPYNEDKAILCWETGNELSSPYSWTSDIVAYIKSLDRNHLVMHGGFMSKETVEDTLVDIVTSHHYSADPSRAFGFLQYCLDLVDGKKPYIIGEFGFAGTPMIEQMLDWIIDHEISGALIWSLRYHRHRGGFYWHSEPFGHGIYKAYHWPGFTSGQAYDEQGIMALMRKKAFEIRNLDPVPLPVPDVPVLLPFQNPTAISWRGSAGAAAYDVQRSQKKKGPWETVGFNISDAAVPYMPLFHDETAEIGASYFYRVIAKNRIGRSEPSNIIGPVQTAYQAWIDDMGSFGRLYDKKGNWKLETAECRKFKEDTERLSGDAGDVLYYRVPGSITGWRVYSFTQTKNQNLNLSVSGDDSTYTEVAGPQISLYTGTDDYQYWRPVLYESGTAVPESNLIKIELSASSRIARVEVYYTYKKN